MTLFQSCFLLIFSALTLFSCGRGVNNCWGRSCGKLSDGASAGTERVYAYITDLRLKKIIVCTIKTTGELSGCVDSGIGVPINAVYGLTAYNGYFYVLNTKTKNIFFCKIEATGKLTSCGDSGAGVSIQDSFGITD